MLDNNLNHRQWNLIIETPHKKECSEIYKKSSDLDLILLIGNALRNTIKL